LRHLASLPHLSRHQVQRWIEDGRVWVNGAAARRPAGRLAAGDEVEVDLPAPPPSDSSRQPLAAQPLPLAVLHEDEHLLAVNKPAGMVVHPAGRYRDGTLANAILWHLQGVAAACREPSGGAAAHEGPPAGPGMVSRLDRDTTGVLLVAKTRAAHAGLARALRARSMQKDYLAVVYGLPPHAKGRIELKILRHPQDRRRVVASRLAGLDAATLYELLADTAGGRLSLLRCRLVTGRMHQIRAHLGAIGLPVVGDPLYGEPRYRGIADPALAAACRDFPRQALHAWRLALQHPVTAQPLTLLAPVPPDLRLLLDVAGLAEGCCAIGGRPPAPGRRP
jgi:23S rRNA pseudouridine1911/1915/1917 synthase